MKINEQHILSSETRCAMGGLKNQSHALNVELQVVESTVTMTITPNHCKLDGSARNATEPFTGT